MDFTDTDTQTPTSRSSSSLSYCHPEALKILKEHWNETHHPKHISEAIQLMDIRMPATSKCYAAKTADKL